MVIIKKLVVSMITLKTTVSNDEKYFFVRERERRSLEVNDKL